MSLDHNLHILVLMGGWSAERDVSLASGRGVAKALADRGFTRVTSVDMDRNIARVLEEHRPDVVFNALHGTPGEDGRVQGLMDLMQIPYTHSGVTTSAVAIDKELTKRVLEPHGIPMPPGKMVEAADVRAADPMPRPYVLKPADEGSSVGVAIVRDDSHPQPLGDSEGPWKEFDRLLCERFIPGRELTVAVLADEALAVTELKIDGGWYDYDHKYTDGMTEHVCPADVPAPIAERMMELALAAHRHLGCKGCSRSDFRWDEDKGEAGLYLIETNTQPGMTPLSLVPEQAAAKGISYGELCEKLIEDALS